MWKLAFDPTELAVQYFDGQHARPRPAWLSRQGDEAVLRTPHGEVRLAWRDIEWPERVKHPQRTAHIASGGSFCSDDGPTWDAWLRAHHGQESWVVRAQQSWRATLLAVILLAGLSLVTYQWGLPWVARGALQALPLSMDVQVGQMALDGIEGRWVKPSKLPPAVQQRLRQRFQAALARDQQKHPWQLGPREIKLHFRASHIGPNAFALPDGSLVLTDDLVELLQDREDVLLGVLGHELGHVQARHGMRSLVQSSLLGAITSVALNDVGGLIAGVPALLGHLHYSRQMERQADDTAIRFLKANDLSPSVMAIFFERLQKSAAAKQGQHAGQGADDHATGLWGIALSSHPADAERIARYRSADTAR